MRKFNRVFSIQWHLTDKCDQRCKHCYIYGRQRKVRVHSELDLNECFMIVEDFLQFCQTMECDPFFSITGGDPLLFSGVWELLRYLYEKEIPFSILGNPFHLNKKVADRLYHLGCRSYQMSLDGLQKTHDELRKPGSFAATLDALTPLKDSGIKTVIMSTVSKLNYQEIPQLVRVVVDNKVDSFGFARYCPAPKDTKYILSPQEYKNFLSKVWEVYTELAQYEANFVLKDHLWILFLYENGLFEIQKENDTILEGCNCGIRHMTVLPDGTVYACRRFDSPVGKVPDQSFVDIFLNERMDKYRRIDKLEGCKNCELLNYCRGCHAVSYGVFGDFFAKDPQCWKNI